MLPIVLPRPSYSVASHYSPRTSSCKISAFLVYALELNLKDESSIWWDEAWEAAVAVCHLSRDGENTSLA
jgi:hypothetical protein